MFPFRKTSQINEGPIEYIIVGLGNPGEKYADTRHNAGFIVIDTLAEKYNIKISKIKFKSLCAQAVIGGHKVLLLKPSTFMNLSGQAVTEAATFYKVAPENTIIIYDDISLEPGKIRMRRKGSDGGHNGMKNIIYLSASDKYPRIKVGVGAKPHPDYDLADWVLSRFDKKEAQLIKEAANNACDALELIMDGKMDVAMNRYN